MHIIRIDRKEYFKEVVCMKKGFTLIEIAIVIVIIGILTAIAIPNFVKLLGRSKEASVVANMHTTQVTLETEGIERGGVYPPVDTLKQKLPRNIKNPFNPTDEAVVDITDETKMGRVKVKVEDNDYEIIGIGENDSVLDLTLTPAQHTF